MPEWVVKVIGEDWEGISVVEAETRQEAEQIVLRSIRDDIGDVKIKFVITERKVDD
jgi:hypothetical protein